MPLVISTLLIRTYVCPKVLHQYTYTHTHTHTVRHASRKHAEHIKRIILLKFFEPEILYRCCDKLPLKDLKHTYTFTHTHNDRKQLNSLQFEISNYFLFRVDLLSYGKHSLQQEAKKDKQGPHQVLIGGDKQALDKYVDTLEYYTIDTVIIEKKQAYLDSDRLNRP